MRVYLNKSTGKWHVRLMDGSMSKGFDSKAELMQLLSKLNRDAREKERIAVQA